jgi:hypothetical protein
VTAGLCEEKRDFLCEALVHDLNWVTG